VINSKKNTSQTISVCFFSSYLHKQQKQFNDDQSKGVAAFSTKKTTKKLHKVQSKHFMTEIYKTYLACDRI